jgi:hypothetical protein
MYFVIGTSIHNNLPSGTAGLGFLLWTSEHFSYYAALPMLLCQINLPLAWHLREPIIKFVMNIFNKVGVN